MVVNWAIAKNGDRYRLKLLDQVGLFVARIRFAYQKIEMCMHETYSVLAECVG